MVAHGILGLFWPPMHLRGSEPTLTDTLHIVFAIDASNSMAGRTGQRAMEGVRRIIDRLLKSAGGESRPTLESDSMILLFSHVRTGRWASVMPSKLAETLGLTETIRAIPITEPEAVHTIGLVVPAREPMTPLNAALVNEAKRLARDISGQDLDSFWQAWLYETSRKPARTAPPRPDFVARWSTRLLHAHATHQG